MTHRQKKVEKHSFDYDLLVLGSGPAGVHGAVQAAKLKKKVAIIEKTPNKLGGALVHTGTIPSKTMREVLAAVHSINEHVGNHWVHRLIDNISSKSLLGRAFSVAKEEETLIKKHLKTNGIEVITGHGHIEDEHTLRVIPPNGNPSKVTGKVILVSTGSRPRRPDNIPFDGWRVVDSDDILQLENLPSSILIFGAGVIGCEFACIFSALGVKTTIVDTRSRIMQSIDREISEELMKTMEDIGVQFKLGYQLKHITHDGPSVISEFHQEQIASDLFFFAAGRVSTTKHIGLKRVGIETNERGTILVNHHFQTSMSSIYAAGDAIGPPALAATSMVQGRLAVCHAFGVQTKGFPPQYPIGVYTIPELSTVGYSEEQVQQQGIDYVVGRANYDEVARGYIRGDSHGLLKIIACKKTQQLLGIHIVGADAANLIHIGLCCMLAKMALQELINSVIFNFPTLAESYRVAAFNALNKIYPTGIIEDPPKDENNKAA